MRPMLEHRSLCLLKTAHDAGASPGPSPVGRDDAGVSTAAGERGDGMTLQGRPRSPLTSAHS